MALKPQDFIRALRAPTDPPAPAGPEKVQIAREAWNNPALYVPNKREAIAEFLLARLLKDKDRASHENPIFDPRYWSLLRDVLLASDVPKSRSAKSWLVPILQRTPLAPVANAVLASWLHRTAAVSDQVLPAAHCLSILWPLAVPKFSPETLLECLGSVIRLLSDYSSFRQALDPTARTRVEHLLTQIAGSYRYSVTNTSNKKKLYTAFSAAHLQSWLECVRLQENASSVPVYSDVYEAGIETLFNVDVLRQSQDREDSPYLEPLSSVMTQNHVAACHALPRLFQAFIQATRRHKAAVFGQSSHQAPGSSADQARLASLKFFAMCDTLLTLVNDDEARWGTKAKLLRVMSTEGLYGASNGSVDEVLRRIGEETITGLASSIAENKQTLVEHTLDILSTIISIDYDLLSSSTPRILRLLLLVAPTTAPAYTYLKQLLDYHVKTRTLDVLVEALLMACAARSSVDRLTASASPILQHTFLDDFSRSLKSFLTPGQVSGTVDTVLGQLREQLEGIASLDGESGEPQKKKRKTEKTAASPATEHTSQAAVAFSLSSRVASVVLSSTPTRYLQDDTKSSVIGAVQDFYAFERSKLKDILKRIRRGDSSRDLQWIAASVLRLQYSIRTSPSVPISTQGDQKTCSKLLSTLESPVIPELRVQILHTLLSDIDLGHCEPNPVFDEVFNLLENSASGHAWSGNVYDIETDAQATIATSHLLVDRWLSLLDAAATEEQLARFARLVTSSRLSSDTRVTSATQLDLPRILHRALHNAEFWELQRIRGALLQQIDAATKALDTVDVLAALQNPRGAGSPPPDAAGAYRLLLYIPAEYLSRAIRGDLLRRALAADALADAGDAHAKLFVREFLRRLFVFLGIADHALVGPYLAFLLLHGPQAASSAPFAATSELVRVHLVACVKASLKGEHELLRDVVAHFASFVSGRTDLTAQELAWQGLMHFIDIIVAEGKPEEYDPSIQEGLRALHSKLLSLLLPMLKETGAQELDAAEIAERTLLLSLWHRLLVFQRWLSSEGDFHAFGKNIAAKLLLQQRAPDAPWARLYLATLAIVVEECRSTQQQDEYLEVVLASYLAFYRECDEQGRRNLDDLVSRFFKSLSGTSFSAVLDLVYDGLSRPGLKLEDVLVHIFSLLLQNAPEGSSKVMQASLTRCLQLFAAKQEFLHDGVVHEEILRFIARQFNDRPALVRQIDLSSVWSILGQSLEGSTTHDRSSNKAVFHEVVSIVGALVRLRRDLTVSTLPHLAFVLRRLLASLRQLRPQLGAKQSKLVTDTLPRWVCAADALAQDEARALARLLTTMTAKTVVRGTGAGADAGKAESLARPFAKHAAYVLQAYIEALNDPLCVVPAVVRKELEPGLFALCDMMGEYSRDALMVSALDTGGKTVLKNIWREYEKQKYVGRG